MSSSPPDIGALANGELRVGRVDGRPIPNPSGVGDGAVGVGDATKGVGPFSGVPGGVVLESILADVFGASSVAALGDDGVTWIFD